MITEKEFEEAFKIVNLYVEQLNNDIIIKQNIVDNFSKTNISDWIYKKRTSLKTVTNNHTRLFNILKANFDYKIDFIEDVRVYEFERFKNSSNKIQILFDELYLGDSNEADA